MKRPHLHFAKRPPVFYFNSRSEKFINWPSLRHAQTIGRRFPELVEGSKAGVGKRYLINFNFRMNSTSGFTLIEILVSLMIISIMGGLLYTSLTQLNFGAQVADNLIDESQRAFIIHQQMEKDFMGVMEPVAAQLEEEKREKEAVTKTPQVLAENQQKPTGVQTPVERKEKPKPVTKVFSATNKEANLETLTFITNNPLQVYWGEKTGRAKPRIARVVYRLVGEKDAKNVFKLVRQEGNNLYFDSYKPGSTKEIREFVLAENIKSLTMTYYYQLEPKENEKKQGNEKKKKETKSESVWDSDKKEQVQKRNGKLYPDWISMIISLWDAQRTRATDYEFKIQRVALGTPPTAKIEQSAMPTPMAPQPGVLQPGQGQSSNLDVLAQQVDALLSGVRSHLRTSTALPNTTPRGMRL